MTRKHSARPSARPRTVVRRTPVKVAAALVVAGLAVSACGSVKMGAAAITGPERISSSTLTDQVANLRAAYRVDDRVRAALGELADACFQVFRGVVDDVGRATLTAKLKLLLA